MPFFHRSRRKRPELNSVFSVRLLLSFITLLAVPQLAHATSFPPNVLVLTEQSSSGLSAAWSLDSDPSLLSPIVTNIRPDGWSVVFAYEVVTQYPVLNWQEPSTVGACCVNTLYFFDSPTWYVNSDFPHVTGITLPDSTVTDSASPHFFAFPANQGIIFSVAFVDLGDSPVSTVPEPSSISLLAFGLSGLGFLLRMKRS